MTELKHTPTPWTKDRSARLCGANGQTISLSGTGIGLSSGPRDPQSEIDGEFVLTAINNHDDMVLSLRQMRMLARFKWGNLDPDANKVIKIAEALLKRLEGKEE